MKKCVRFDPYDELINNDIHKLNLCEMYNKKHMKYNKKEIRKMDNKTRSEKVSFKNKMTVNYPILKIGSKAKTQKKKNKKKRHPYVKTDEELKELKKKSRRGDAKAKYQIGKHYYNLYYDDSRVDDKKMKRRAIEWYRKSAKLNYSRALFTLGTHIYQGKSARQEKLNALKMIEKAADLGEFDAKVFLTNAYARNGFPFHSIYWHKKAIKHHSNVEVELNAAENYEESLGIDIESGDVMEKQRHLRIMFQLYMFEAESLNKPDAMLRISDLYQDGIGTKIDLKSSFEWCKKSAEKGNVDAMLKLSHLYEKGIGVPISEIDAAKWAKEAASQGNKDAMLRIAEFYQAGYGVGESDEESKFWYDEYDYTVSRPDPDEYTTDSDSDNDDDDELDSDTDDDLSIQGQNENSGNDDIRGDVIYITDSDSDDGDESNHVDNHSKNTSTNNNYIHTLESVEENSSNTSYTSDDSDDSLFAKKTEVSKNTGPTNNNNDPDWIPSSISLNNDDESDTSINYSNRFNTRNNRKKLKNNDSFDKTLDKKSSLYCTNKNKSKTFMKYKEEAESGDENSLYKLAKCYNFGIGTNKNEEKAIECYKKLSKLGFVKAKIRLNKLTLFE
jgi:TPR repeat protein